MPDFACGKHILVFDYKFADSCFYFAYNMIFYFADIDFFILRIAFLLCTLRALAQEPDIYRKTNTNGLSNFTQSSTDMVLADSMILALRLSSTYSQVISP